MCGEPPACYWERTVTARIRHRCCECGATIEVGDQYRLCSGVWEGRGAAYKRCGPCWEVAGEIEQWLQDGDCYPSFTALADDVWNIAPADRTAAQPAMLARIEAGKGRGG